MILHFVESTYFQISLDHLIHIHTKATLPQTGTFFVAQILILDKNLAQTHDDGDTHTCKFGNFKCLCVCMSEIRDNLRVCVCVCIWLIRLANSNSGLRAFSACACILHHSHIHTEANSERERGRGAPTHTDR